MGEELTPAARDELRRVANEATLGPWESDQPGRVRTAHPDFEDCADEIAETLANDDAQFIATFDPPTVLDLLDALERLERELVVYKDQRGHLAQQLEDAQEETAAAEAARDGLVEALREMRERAEFWTTRDPSTIGYLYDATAVKFAGEVLALIERLEAAEAAVRALVTETSNEGDE